MTELDMSLVKKGLHEPREGLRDQGVVSAGLAREHEEPLAEHGWKLADTADLESLTGTLGSRVADQAESKIASKGATADEVSARSNAKATIGKVRLGASIVLAKKDVPDVTMESFEAGHTLGQSTPKISMYLEKILPAVQAIDDDLKPYFKGESAAALVTKARQSLDAAQAVQEVSLATLPRETLEVYETKGRLLRRIEELNKVAKIAFWEHKEIAGLFNKDVLNRARKTRKKAAAQQ